MIDRIESMIKESSAVIADLSGASPNVMFETGYAHGFGRRVIHISSTPAKDLPFDVAQWPTILYERGRANQKAPLLKRLKAIMH